MDIYQVDSFASKPFTGNPAGVCVLPGPGDETWMQSVAAEMNVSETAFVHESGDGFALRWFTPKAEVSLCGHGTLATAHILWETGLLGPDAVARFATLSGLLTAERRAEEIELDFPAQPAGPAEAPEGLLDALTGGSKLGDAVVRGRNGSDYLVEVGSESVLRALSPDFLRLRGVKARGVMVTARSEGDRYDFVSRFFAPAFGVNEDPVTGSAHCCLGPFWGERLGKTEMLAFQASERGGEVWVRLSGNRVKLGGRAITVIRGTLET